MSKIIKNCCVAYDIVPRVIGVKTRIIKAQKNEDVGNILSNNALESADISLKTALRNAVSMAEQSKVQAQIAYTAAHKSGREHGYSEGLEKGNNDGFKQSKEKADLAINEFLAKAGSLDINYKSRIEEAKGECIDFAFSLAENILGSKINCESPEFTNIKNTYLSAQSRTVKIEADGRVLELETLNPDWLINSAEGLSGITALLKQESLEPDDDASLIDAQKTEDCQKQESETVKPVTYEISSETSILKNQTENQDEKPVEEKISEKSVDRAFKEAAVSTIQKKIVEKETDFSGEQEKATNDVSDIKEEPIVFPDLDDDSSDIDNNYDVPDDKLVYIRPSVKPAALNSAEILKFENLVQIKKESLKAILRKVSVKDMTSALSGVSDDLSKVLLSACPRKTKEKVLDAIKYLGPAPENEVDQARKRIVSLACEYLKREE